MVGKLKADKPDSDKQKKDSGGRRRKRVDFEVEIKLPFDDVAPLLDSGLAVEVVTPRRFEDNWVYKLPDGKLRKGQYLRVRYVGDGNGSGRRHEGILTYKGKARRESAASKRDNKGKKVREEIETSVGQPSKVAKIIKRLGLTRSFRYQRFRTVYTIAVEDGQTLLAMFDETPIGNFLELEGEAALIETVASALGFPSSAFIAESYVEIQIKRCAARGEGLKDMVFRRMKKSRKPAEIPEEAAAAAS
ncbi:MAG TPA: class IV adenylate cyclase [Blastocatellia bacterium]|nr:class IV adenylate cyclase [Blastocatellia bacterium]